MAQFVLDSKPKVYTQYNKNRQRDYPHFTDGEIAVPRGWLTCPKSHSWKEGKLKDKPKFISTTSLSSSPLRPSHVNAGKGPFGVQGLTLSVVLLLLYLSPCTHLATDPGIQAWRTTRLPLSRVCAELGWEAKESGRQWSGGGGEPSHLGTVRKRGQLWTDEKHWRKRMLACSLLGSVVSLGRVRWPEAAGNCTFSNTDTFF